jgi:hypothetical protein
MQDFHSIDSLKNIDTIYMCRSRYKHLRLTSKTIVFTDTFLE